MRAFPRSRRARIVASLALLLVLFLAATARLFVWPPTDRPVRVDAVVALGGDPGQRRALQAIALVREGFAPVAVISLGGTPPAPCPRRGVPVICFRPNPLDTRGEAEYVAGLSARRHWHRLIVVPERSQTTRARMVFERCISVRLFMVPVNDPPSHLGYDITYEWAAFAKALLLYRSC